MNFKIIKLLVLTSSWVFIRPGDIAAQGYGNANANNKNSTVSSPLGNYQTGNYQTGNYQSSNVNRSNSAQGSNLGYTLTSANYGSSNPTSTYYQERAIEKGNSKTLPVSLEKTPANLRDAIYNVIKHPSIQTSTKMDRFYGYDTLYLWLLDHPATVALGWRRLGIPALDIREIQSGKFQWKDERNQLTWITVARGSAGRVWYAEGTVNPGPMMPIIPVRAVAVLHHDFYLDKENRTIIVHRVDCYMQSESKIANLVTKMMGSSASHMAESGADQLLFYFSGITRYLYKYPKYTRELLKPIPSETAHNTNSTAK